MSPNTEAIDRRTVVKATSGFLGVLGMGGSVSAAKADEKDRSEELPVPEDEVVDEEELDSFDSDATRVPPEELPIESGPGFTPSSDGGITTQALGDCYGSSWEMLEAQICPNDDGTLEASLGAFGLVADSIVIDEGEATKTGFATVAIPKLPGSIQEFNHEWNVEWSGTTVEEIHFEATLEGWRLGDGWFEITSVDTVVYS